MRVPRRLNRAAAEIMINEARTGRRRSIRSLIKTETEKKAATTNASITSPNPNAGIARTSPTSHLRQVHLALHDAHVCTCMSCALVLFCAQAGSQENGLCQLFGPDVLATSWLVCSCVQVGSRAVKLICQMHLQKLPVKLQKQGVRLLGRTLHRQGVISKDHVLLDLAPTLDKISCGLAGRARHQLQKPQMPTLQEVQ